jgi:hypothetical protein
MTSTLLRRAIAVAGGAVVALLAVTGCSAIPTSAKPTVGQCWRVTYAAAAQSEDWVGAAAVSCSSPHESYTYAIATITQKFAGSWQDSKGNPRADVDAAAFAACLAKEKSLLPGITPKEALFYPTYYVPSVAQWTSGARWVRCDMTEIRVGSEVAKPKLTTLPTRFAELVSELKHNPTKFALCEDDVFNNGPDGASTSYADCTKPADWTFLTRLTLPGGSSAPYPGAAALKSLGAEKCAAAVTAPAGHDIVAKTPTKTSWVQDGVRTVDCWRNNN